MAVDMFIKIDGIKGESADDKHKEEIDVLSCCNGKHLKDAKLVVRKAGENPLEYIILTMEDVIVSSVSNGGSGGEDRLTENVTLNFARVKVDYAAQDAKGGAGAKPKMGWDIAANKKI